MIYLLIDNCTLRDLIDIHSYSKYLTDLENLTSSNKVIFVTHELILEEWKKYKNSWKKDKERKLLGNNKHYNLSLNENTPSLANANFITTNHIHLQIEQIDFLLQNAKIVLKTPDIITSDFSYRYRNKLAPFHNKLNSQNDWEIIGSFCNYCEIQGIRELYFLSSNTTDFADLNNQRSIHRDIKDRFSKVSIRYFSDYSTFFNEINDPNIIPINFIPYTSVPNEKYSYKSTIKKTVIDSLCHIYKEKYVEIDFIPLHILRRYYPFSSSANSNTYYNNFTMSYVTENMIDFFDNIIISEEKEINYKDESLLINIKNYKEKVEFALRKLTSNLVFHICGEKTRRRICTHYYNPKLCDCFRCSFNRFEFSKAFRDIKVELKDYKERLKQAYIHYQLGNYKSANIVYEGIIATALDDGRFITYFIAKYNQKHLANLMDNYFTNKEIDSDLVSKLSQIDPLEEAIKLKTRTDYNLLSYIAKDTFFTDAFQYINETTNKIREHYHSQLNGGWSHNQNIWDLMEKFIRLDQFLNSNFIIYNCYSNFQKLFENIIEGIFASYAITDDQSDKFEKIDNYWLIKFVFYGNRKAIIRLFNHYHLKSLKYEPTSIEKNSLIEIFENLISRNGELQKSVDQYADENNLYFNNKFDKLFENILTMASLLELNKAMLYEFTNILLNYLETKPEIKYPTFQSLKHFINSKGKLLRKKMKYRFLNYYISHNICISDNGLYPLIDSFSDNELSNISNKNFYYLLNHSLLGCNQCNMKHDIELFIKLFEKADNIRKKYITDMVNEVLVKKFDFTVFYLSSLFGIIKLDARRLFSLVSDFKVDVKKKTFRSLFSGETDFQNNYLDEIINLCFKFDIDTASTRFKRLSKVHPYYSWLIDMDNYNYKNFNPEWVLKYQTIYYYKAMAKSSKLKEALKEYLSINFHKGIERILLRITNFTNL